MFGGYCFKIGKGKGEILLAKMIFAKVKAHHLNPGSIIIKIYILTCRFHSSCFILLQCAYYRVIFYFLIIKCIVASIRFFQIKVEVFKQGIGETIIFFLIIFLSLPELFMGITNKSSLLGNG